MRHCALGRGGFTGVGRNGTGQEEFDAGGRYQVRVEPGEVTFRVEVSGLPSPLEGADFTVRVDPGVRTEHQVALRIPTRPIRGRVSFEDGSPAAGARIDASLPNEDGSDDYWNRLHFGTTTDVQGHYLVEVPTRQVPVLGHRTAVSFFNTAMLVRKTPYVTISASLGSSTGSEPKNGIQELPALWVRNRHITYHFLLSMDCTAN